MAEMSSSTLSNQEKNEIKREVAKDFKKKAKKTKKAIKEIYGTRFHQMMKSYNPYLAALLDPWNVHGVKIPDFNSQASATFCLAYRSTVLTNATGNCFIAFGRGLSNTPNEMASLIPMPPPGSGTGSNYRIGFSNNDPSCSPTNLTANGGTNPIVNYQWDAWKSTGGAVQSTFRRVRLVSAGLAVTVQCSLSQAQGKITIVALPRWKTQAQSAQNTMSQAFLEAQPGVRIIDINQIVGASCYYIPIDPVSYSYVDVDQPYTQGSDFNSCQGYAGGELLCSVVGAGAGVSVQFVLVANYEGLPNWNTFNLIQTTPSPIDTIQLESALNSVQAYPQTYIGVGKAQGANAGPQNGTMDVYGVMSQTALPFSVAKSAHAVVQQNAAQNPLGSLGTILEKMPGFIDKGMQIGEKIAPMIEALASMI